MGTLLSPQLKTRQATDKTVFLISHFECSGKPENFLNAYQDGGGVWTIGIGTTYYPNGIKVKKGDVITLQEAYDFMHHALEATEKAVMQTTTGLLSQNQFDALVSFVYNIGPSRYKISHARMYINQNPINFPLIIPKILAWKYDEGEVMPGLVLRRKAEAFLYMTGQLKFEFAATDNIV